MLWVLAVIEVVLWIYGMATGHRMGGVLNFLLLFAAIAVLTELGLRWRRARPSQATPVRQEHSSDWRKAA
jgi:hypothetical protein